MEAVMTEERLVELRENHGPWHYTEFGVLCSCGEAMDANEECPTLQLVSEIDRLHAELAAVKAEKKSLEVESLCAYTDLLKAENKLLGKAVSCFASAIKCGESWSPALEAMLNPEPAP